MTTIRLRRGTAADWASRNPILALGEFGHETDTRKSKVGDGVTAWNGLPYVSVADAFDPNDVGYDIVIVAGQSNAVGLYAGQWVIDTTLLDPVNSRIMQWPFSGAFAALNRPIQAVDQLLHPQIITGGVGPGMPFARELLPQLKPNRKILLLPVAYGGTAFCTSSVSPPPSGYIYRDGGGWDPTGGQGGINRYEFAIAAANTAIASGPNNRVLCTIWVQGETDASLGPTYYQGKLDALIDGFRSRITGAEDMPFIIGQMLPSGIRADVDRAAINTVHIDTPRRKALCAFNYGADIADNDGGVHYSNEGNRINGRNMVSALALARANVLGVAPLTPGVPVLSQSGTSLAVEWSRPVCRVTDYTVRYRINTGAWQSLTRAQSIDKTATITGLTLGNTVDVQVQAVNEAGNSPYTASASIVLQQLPNTASIALGSPAGTSIPYTITAPSVDSTHSAATSYLIEYKKSSASVWSTFATVTQLTGSVTGLSYQTAYNVRVTAINGAGSASASTTQNATTIASVPVIDEIGVSAWKARGLRRLRSAYTGPAIRVRYTDNAEADIGFAAGTNDLDTTTLLAGASAHGGSAWIKTWYDQSGNGRDETQTTTTKQARIVNSDTLDTANSKPVAVFSGAVYVDETSTPFLSQSAACSSMAVYSSTGDLLWSERSATTLMRFGFQYQNSADGKLSVRISNDTGTDLANFVGATLPLNTLAQVSTIDTGTSARNLVNGSGPVAVPYARTGVFTTSFQTFGGTNAFQLMTGKVAELVQWSVALTDGQRAAGEVNQRDYYSIT